MKNQKVLLYPLNVIESEKGNIRHIINKNNEGFDSFSEAYITEINPLNIKGWILHKNKISNLIVVKGHVKFVFLISQKPEKFIVYELAALDSKKDLYSRLCVQPNVWFAFQGLHSKVSRVLNISNVLHSDTVSIRKDLKSFKYSWNKL
tara:strand:- start:128 stop:571 length:444 start_codon:yes stop_codon:yes gene_type:complete